MVMQNLRVFAYIARSYNSAAEATSLVSSVASLAINLRQFSLFPRKALFLSQVIFVFGYIW